MAYPEPIQRLIHHFQKLPGIGPKQGARFAFRLLSMSQNDLTAFSRAISELKKGTAVCTQCFLSFSAQAGKDGHCHICNNTARDQHTICVVEQDQDVANIEKSGSYNGLYHVLKNTRHTSGRIDSTHPAVRALEERTKALAADNAEIIIATSATTSGQEQFLALKDILANHPVPVTRLGRGLSSGIEIEYADPDTLSDAFNTRS